MDRKALLLDVFLHVNRELEPFQRDVLRRVVGHYGSTPQDPEEIYKVVMDINAHIKRLEEDGWEPNRKTGDQVNRPNHYERYPLEPTYFIVTVGGLHWCVENFIKYIVRYRFKNGLEDLRKAGRNLVMYARWLDGDPTWSR